MKYGPEVHPVTVAAGLATGGFAHSAQPFFISAEDPAIRRPARIWFVVAWCFALVFGGIVYFMK
jgi:hypothetical protein